MGKLLNLVSTICIKNKISVYQLEVIQDNEKALTLYKKQGFRINRILNCYQLTGKIKEPGVLVRRKDGKTKKRRSGGR